MPKQSIPFTVKALSAVIVSILSLSLNAAPISNSVSNRTISIDANINDWASIGSLGYDASTLADANAEADFMEGWLAHDNDNLYLAYRNNGDIKTTAWWSWQIYIDTDTSTATGYSSVNKVGADYLIQGSGLYKYTGSGSDWSWQYIATITNKVNGAIAEFQLPRSALGNPNQFRAVFKARNIAFTGYYSASSTDTYPKAFTAIKMHDDILYRQSMIWGESGGTVAMRLASSAGQGATQLNLSASYNLIADQLISYRASNGEYYTAQIDAINGSTVTLKKPLQAKINAGQNVWNFYGDASHPNEIGYRALADFAIRKIGVSKLNKGRHVLLGDSWFESRGIAQRLATRLPNATIVNRGIGGNTSSNMLNRFDRDVANENPDFVWVNAGVNDYNQAVTAPDYLTNIQGIIAKTGSAGAQSIVIDAAVGQLVSGSDSMRQLSHRYVTALASNAGGGFVDYTLGAALPPPDTGELSNPTSITIDGNLSDWNTLQSFGADGNDVNVAGAKADILEAWAAHDDTHFYMAYRNDGNIVKGTWWPWQTYLDTDNDASTGFDAGNGVGANYIIQGGGLYRYIGTGRDWAWQYVTTANYVINGNVVELGLPRAAIGNPSAISAVMMARNGIFNGDYSAANLDRYPNTGLGHFNYRLVAGSSNNASRTFSNSLANDRINLDGRLGEWGTVRSFGRDPNDITVANSKADWLEAWAAHDANHVYFAYENDGAINPVSWPYQIYIDTDNNPDTGFKVTGGLGAEFIIEGTTLRRYNGTGWNWSWDTLVVTDSATNGAFSEIAIPRSALNGSSNFRVLFKANNQPFTGSFDSNGVDYFPNNALSSDEGYFSYSIR